MAKQSNKTEYATKSDLKGLRKDINQDIKTHMGVLYEKFSDNVKVLAEAHQDTNKRARGLEAKIGGLGTEMGNLGIKIVGLETKVEGLEVKMDTLVDTAGEIKVDVAEIKEGLKNKADLKDQKLLEKRVAVLEATA